MTAAPLTPELMAIGAEAVRKLDGTTDDFWGYLDSDDYQGRDLTRDEAHAIALYFDTKLGRCSECEYLCPIGELQGEVEGGTCYSCGGPKE